jgi:hypothetical protein
MKPPKPRPDKRPPTSAKLDDISAELRHAGDRAMLQRLSDDWLQIRKSLDLPEGFEPFRRDIEFGRAAKKNFAQRLSNALAQKIADALRPEFRQIYPDATGAGQESVTRGARGKKKLDVNYSLQDSGLHLAVSLKTINFFDKATKRYTKNAKRVDGELRAEAQDCHQRQPYAVLATILLLPEDAAADGKDKSRSSFKHLWDVLRTRTGRTGPGDDHSLFEFVFIGLYSSTSGAVRFIDAGAPGEPPDRGIPNDTKSFTEVLACVRDGYRLRNRH